MKYFSMFSGIGGFELALPEKWECVGYSEICPRAIQIYEKHFKHKNFGNANDINPQEIPCFDWLFAGFPCQSFSIAGKRKGFDDMRGTQFFNIARIIEEKRPRHILLENVKGLLSHDKGRTFKIILSTLTELGYDCESMVFDGYFFNAAPRQRIFMYAYDREQESSHGERQIKALSLLSSGIEIFRNQGKQNLEENMRNARGIIRKFAKLPSWLDGWDTIYGQES